MKKHFRLMAVLLIAIFWLVPTHAQDQDSENIAMLVMITPEEGHDEALLKAITDYHHWVANFDGHMEYNWYRVLTGPHTGKYAARTGGHNWADFDAKYDWQEKANEVFESNVAPHIKHMEVNMTRELVDMSHWPENWEGYTHFNVENWYVKNGHYGAFRKGLKRIVDTLKAGGYDGYWGFHSVESGGYGGQMTIVSPNKGWGDMSEPETSFSEIMIKDMGSEEAFSEFMANWGETFKIGRNWTVEYMPEASDYGKD